MVKPIKEKRKFTDTQVHNYRRLFERTLTIDLTKNVFGFYLRRRIRWTKVPILLMRVLWPAKARKMDGDTKSLMLLDMHCRSLIERNLEQIPPELMREFLYAGAKRANEQAGQVRQVSKA